MIPKEQKLEYYWGDSTYTIYEFFKRLVDQGWVVHQMIPYSNKSYYFICYKY